MPELEPREEETATPSVTRLPTATPRPTSGRGSTHAASEIPSGSQIRIESVTG